MGFTPELQVPHDEDLEVDVIAAIARDGDARPLLEILDDTDFWSHGWLFRELRLAGSYTHHLDVTLVDELATIRWRWTGLPDWVSDRLDEVVRTAGGGVDPHTAARRLREISRTRRLMAAAGQLYNAIGAHSDDVDQAAAELLELLEPGAAA